MKDLKLTPDEILAKIKAEEAEKSKGKLKIFLGAIAGVGKTYAMLEAAQQLKQENIDCVGGVIITHGRMETQALLTDLEIIPQLEVKYKDVTLNEPDIDAILKRKPKIVLIDELAHSNAPGVRHSKRYQDVEELLQANIDVYTTLNIQHIESLNDIIAQITGIKVQETVPDYIIENAHEIKLIDLPPDELIERLNQGKIYLADQTQNALKNFFRKGNLIALRELALRVVADKVDAQMLKYRISESIENIWPITEKIVVCIGPSPLSYKLVRATKRMAIVLKTNFTAVYVETPNSIKMSEVDRKRITRTLELAENLGGQTAVLSGHSVSNELINFAVSQNVTKIVIGKPARPRVLEILFGSAVDEIIRKSGDIDIYVITGSKDSDNTQLIKSDFKNEINFNAYLKAIIIIACTTLLVKFLFHRLTQVNLVMLYQLAIVIIAVRYGKGASILSSVLSVAVFDFFFVPPYLSFVIADTQYLVTFFVMLIVGLTLSTLTSTVQNQAKLARKRELSTSVLYRMTCDLIIAHSLDSVIKASVKHISEVFDAKIAVILSQGNEQLIVIPDLDVSFDVNAKEFGVAQWVYINQQPAGLGTQTLAGAQALYMPLSTSLIKSGVIGILPKIKARLLDPSEMHLLETFINQMSLAIERANLTNKR